MPADGARRLGVALTTVGAFLAFLAATNVAARSGRRRTPRCASRRPPCPRWRACCTADGQPSRYDIPPLPGPVKAAW